MELWRRGGTRIPPTLMINAFGDLETLPRRVSPVIAHGEKDVGWTKRKLEKLMQNGTVGICHLHWTADGHLMRSLLDRDGEDLLQLLETAALPKADL